MASYIVPAGHVGVHAKTLAASTVDTVTFVLGSTSSPGWGKMPRSIEVITDGVADIYVTVNGATPTVAGTDCFRVPAAAGATVIDVDGSGAAAPVVVKLISAGTPAYSVSRA